MDIWANKILIEFVPLVAILLLGAIAYATHRYTGSLLYRFQKAHEDSRGLAEIFDFDKSMPRTANRTTGTHSLIKINAHGRNRSP
jgi:hypothetical protein